ncbi:glycerophosphodiester phosphodiesterase family protein [Parapusillimonas sp. SGNA-6]|uniref:glycerophosphodiester phosphodiesterase family protein n=1 Tax=Parapedobacter sp. SGR-10 TaxID=2710879 RepID=UPI0013D3388D|nr:glycerophosphodiester phosphodiesterase family protein [Parapedobacter sp. SGR-10]NGF55434.1 glycerophosphodiester phosphodiesterase family protein [Parapedobacter sp. SGR-10]NGM89634.1 glycerophosphodiester phosphodiesterase family protein [Parapusillimonas sp. SGNA-6]
MILLKQAKQLSLIVGLSLLFAPHSADAQKKKSNYLNFKTTEELQDFFRYKNDGSIIISGHRGGIDFPENSLEGLQGVLDVMPAFFEIDPRLTKDSVIVLMHDATLDRTTTATGKLSDYTYAELASVRLKDAKGNVTPYKIPTLEETILWSRGKTVINLDKKDVPLHMVVELIRKHKAEKHVMLTVHTGAQARYYYDHFPNIMLSAFARNEKEYADMEISGVPWKNTIAYVGWTIDKKNEAIVRKLREKGVRCMISVAPSHDKIKDAIERDKRYQEEIDKKPDIIESDLPIEVWKVLHGKK